MLPYYTPPETVGGFMNVYLVVPGRAFQFMVWPVARLGEYPAHRLQQLRHDLAVTRNYTVVWLAPAPAAAHELAEARAACFLHEPELLEQESFTAVAGTFRGHLVLEPSHTIQAHPFRQWVRHRWDLTWRDLMPIVLVNRCPTEALPQTQARAALQALPAILKAQPRL